MKNAYLRNTMICVAVHLACLYILIAFSLCSCHARRPTSDMTFFVDFQPGPPPAAALAAAPASETAEQAEPEPAEVPETIPEPPKTEQPKPKPTPSETVKKPKVEVSTNLVRRAAAPGAKKPVKQLSASQIRSMLGGAVAGVGGSSGRPGGVAGGSEGAGYGSGSGEVTPYGWYLAQVRAIMYDAWQQPSTLAGKRGLVTRVLVRVRQDGQIGQKNMIGASGNSLMDASVMQAVESVTRLPELPYGFGGAYKDITIDFELEDTGP